MDQQGQRGELFKAIKISFLVSHDQAKNFPSIMEWADFFFFFFLRKIYKGKQLNFHLPVARKFIKVAAFDLMQQCLRN